MELKNFLIYLKGFKAILIVVPLIALTAALLFVRRLPDSFVSKTQIATGIVDQTQQVIESQDNYGRDSKNNEQFINLQEVLQMDKVVSQVSYNLLIHDLTNNKPYRDPKGIIKKLDPSFINQTISLLKRKLQTFDLLNLNDAFELKVDSLLKKFDYDYETLLKKNLKIFHSEGSDFINIQGDSEKPGLSAFIVNDLSNSFIRYYTDNINQGHNKSSEFLEALLGQKKQAMNSKIAALQQYKIANGILDMEDESKDIYGQINDLETHLQQSTKDVIAYSGALKSINKKFDPNDRQYFEATATKINMSIVSTRERLRQLNDRYIQNNFNPRYKAGIDSLQTALNAQINESADKYISNPLAAKQNIVEEKLKMENELELARYSETSLGKQLIALKAQINKLVPAQATVSSYERDIDVATKEYLSIQDKYSQANLSTTIPIQLKQLDTAMPGEIKGSKKILLVCLSAVTAFIICLVTLLIFFYLDDTIKNSDDLESKTQIPVIGHLNLLRNAKDRNKFRIKQANDINMFRDLLRSIRFEIDNELKDNRVLAITSLGNSEGKTLFAFSLAYAYAMINKNVLLIDGNFANPAISHTVKSNEYLEDYFTGATQDNSENRSSTRLLASGEELSLNEISSATAIGGTLQRLNAHSNIDYDHKAAISVLGNKGKDVSLLEISSKENIRYKIDFLKLKYDVILIETGSLGTLNKSKEWMQFADNTIAVFENNTTLKTTHKRQLKYLKSLNSHLIGWVLNKVPVNHESSVLV